MAPKSLVFISNFFYSLGLYNLKTVLFCSEYYANHMSLTDQNAAFTLRCQLC
jgi:hypothetical protein